MDEFETMVHFGWKAVPALIAGLILGIERNFTSPHWVGIKTVATVSLGSCLFTTLGFYLDSLEASRVIPAIITGVGFLGAGAIFRDNEKVTGLSSAAMIWASCALGTMAGAGLFWVPIFASATLVVISYGLRRLEEYLERFKK